MIGGIAGGTNEGSLFSNDFTLGFFLDSPGKPGTSKFFEYTTTSTGPADFGSGGDNLQITISDPSATPEPSTWAFLLTGVAAVGAALRFGRRRTAVLASA